MTCRNATNLRGGSAFALLLLAFAPLAGAADNWTSQESDCSDFQLPGFKARGKSFKRLMNDGRSFDSRVAQELLAIQKVSTVTCKKWAADPNGDRILAQFTSELAGISQAALALRKTAEGKIAPALYGWWQKENAELAPYGMAFRDFPCGRAFLRSEQGVERALGSIEESFNGLKDTCPKAADSLIAKAKLHPTATHAAGDGGAAGAVTPGSNPKVPASDITGTTKAIDEAAKSRDATK
jgi:hypothetical protein